jgi:hypothetical protein
MPNNAGQTLVNQLFGDIAGIALYQQWNGGTYANN